MEVTGDVVQMLVQGVFNPQTVVALAHQLKIPTFMCCPGSDFTYPVTDFGMMVISRMVNVGVPRNAQLMTCYELFVILEHY